MRGRFSLVFAAVVLILGSSAAQISMRDSIFVPNGSFENTPHIATLPDFWEGCGYNSTPDILPGPWGVTLLAANGYSYIGLTAREDKTYESMSCLLPESLKKDSCYTFKIMLARSSSYAGFKGAGCFRLWGGDSNCAKKQLLAVSNPIQHYDWKTYAFSFISLNEYDYITIECYYKTPSLFPYRANLLIDSFLFFESCERA